MLVTTVKDEGPNILEWISYHRMIGFTDIVVFQNNSFDTTEPSLRMLHTLGVIRYYNNDFRKQGITQTYQNRAYRRAARLDMYGEADWCMALDGDEFLKVNLGAGTVQELIAAVGDADELRVNWRVFGSSHLRALDNRLVTERFVWANAGSLPERHPMPVKTLFRTASFARPGIHLPKTPRIDGTITRNGSGRAAPEFVTRGFQVTDPEPYKLAQINHYMVKDSDSFLMKAARGSSSHPDRAIALDYWRKRNVNSELDRGMVNAVDALRDDIATLDARTDGRLTRQRNRALRQWRDRIATLKAQPDMAELYEHLV